jgi:hypothetical protein
MPNGSRFNIAFPLSFLPYLSTQFGLMGSDIATVRGGILPLWSSGHEFLVTDPEVKFRFPALPDSPRSSGSGTGSSQPLKYTRGFNGVTCSREVVFPVRYELNS